jgi:hypothetical protein
VRDNLNGLESVRGHIFGFAVFSCVGYKTMAVTKVGEYMSCPCEFSAHIKLSPFISDLTSLVTLCILQITLSVTTVHHFGGCSL